MMLPTQTLRDLSDLTLDQVQHEYDLCYEILHGIYVDGELVIKGFLDPEPDYQGDEEQFKLALNHWKARLENAKAELIERHILF